MSTPPAGSSSAWSWWKSTDRGYAIPRASSSANCLQFLRSAWVLLPLGHHCTLPRPISSRPNSSFPLRTSMSSVLFAFQLGQIDRIRQERRNLGYVDLALSGHVRRSLALLALRSGRRLHFDLLRIAQREIRIREAHVGNGFQLHAAGRLPVLEAHRLHRESLDAGFDHR